MPKVEASKLAPLMDIVSLGSSPSIFKYAIDHMQKNPLNQKWRLYTAEEQPFQDLAPGEKRSNSPWVSPPDNVYATFSISWPPANFNKTPYLGAVTSVAIAHLLEDYGFSKVKIKWPNDVLVNNKKISGIGINIDLASMNVLINVGLNVNMSRDICDTIDQPATSMFIEKAEMFDKQEVLEELALQLHQDLSLLAKEGFSPTFRPYILNHAACLGEEVGFISPAVDEKLQKWGFCEERPYSFYEGIFSGLGEKGELILTIGKTQKQFFDGTMRSKERECDPHYRDLGKAIVSMVSSPKVLEDIVTTLQKGSGLNDLNSLLHKQGIQAVYKDPEVLTRLGYTTQYLVQRDLLGDFKFGHFLKTMVAEWSSPTILSTPIREALVKTLVTPLEEPKPKVLIFPEEQGTAKVLITYPAKDTGMQILTYEYDVDIEDSDKLPIEEVQKLHLRIKLQLEEVGLIDQNGQLTQRAIERSEPMKDLKIKNPYVIHELTKDGTQIEDWNKVYTKDTIVLRNGKKADLHFYKHKSGKVNTNIDFKLKGTIPRD